MVSYSLILSTENGTQTTKGNPADYTWGFDWSEFEAGNYEMIFTFLSDNLNQIATYNDINRPCINLDLGGILPNAFEVVDVFTSRRSQHIGFLRSEIQAATNGIFLYNVKSVGSKTISFFDGLGIPHPIDLINGLTYSIKEGTGGDSNTGSFADATYTAAATGQLTSFDVTSATNQICSQVPVTITPPNTPTISPNLGMSYITGIVAVATTASLTFTTTYGIILATGVNYTITGNAGTAIGTITGTGASRTSFTFGGTAKSLAVNTPVVFTPTADVAGKNYPKQVLSTASTETAGGTTVTILTSATSAAGVNTITIPLATATTFLNGVTYIVYTGNTVTGNQLGLYTAPDGVAKTSITFIGSPITFASGDNFAFYPASNLNIVNGINFNTIYSGTATTLTAGKTYNVLQNSVIIGTVVGDGNAKQQYTLVSSTAQVTPNTAFSFIGLFVPITSTTLLANITYSQFIGTTYIGDITYAADTAITSVDATTSPAAALNAGTMVSFIPPTTQLYIPAGATLLKDVYYYILGTNVLGGITNVVKGTGTAAVTTYTLTTPTALYSNADITFNVVAGQAGLAVQSQFASSAPTTGFTFPAQSFTSGQVGTYNAAGEQIEATYDAAGVYAPTVAISLGTGVTTGTFSTAQNIINQNIELTLLNGATTGVCQLYTNINDNPPVYYRILGNTTGKIRIWLTNPSSLTNGNQNQNSFGVPSLSNWSVILRFTKVDKIKNGSSYQVVDDVLFSK